MEFQNLFIYLILWKREGFEHLGNVGLFALYAAFIISALCSSSIFHFINATYSKILCVCGLGYSLYLGKFHKLIFNFNNN